ncbi:subtilisin-like protease SBT3.5 [Oryza brachyantha]|uniref:subtilisin-like protease SBT3.5 n=1 Tax=Oryza brachyantha TaxID=4533 RepID=UPI0003EAD348|nr:subtilisin-like protease SBT3.5 [Oryza brachyantha]
MAGAYDNGGSHCRLIIVFFLVLLLPLQISFVVCQQSAAKKLYVVYLGEKQHDDPERTTASHHDMLTAILGSEEEAHDSMIYSYRHGFSGFSAMLTESQAYDIAELPEVRSIKLSVVHPMHTTRSQEFIGLDYTKPNGLLHDANYGEGVIIGVIDSGIWPESSSFRDHGLGPVPSKWKGICQAGEKFSSNQCNRKIIGARWYVNHLTPKDFEGEYKSARCANGHGTHVASTAAGALVPNVSFHGLAAGYARGVAPYARIAVYKACWKALGCDDTAVLQAIDDAIHDGVDVLSLSIGLADFEFYGSLHAVQSGITVVFSAGNTGPAPRTVANASPWTISVASTTIDRTFPTVITFANSSSDIVGQSLFYETAGEDNWYEIYSTSCFNGTSININATLASGRIVFCYSPSLVSLVPPGTYLPSIARAAKKFGAKGIIYSTYSLDNLVIIQELCGSIPCVLVDFDAFHVLENALENTTPVLARFTPTRTWIGGEVLAPRISTFSSRGPSPLLPQFLKPDVAAPGSDILAAVQDSYKFKSGTSMACPHVSGVAALLKALHPEWSPAIIKSAIVTTASNDRNGFPILADGLPRKIADPFDFGGGFIDPNRAMDPGLAYDVDPKDYTSYFDCFSASNSSCESESRNLNLPSIAIPNLKASTTVLRTVTNVGQPDAVYKAIVQSPPGMQISVEPAILKFCQGKNKQSFKITFTLSHKVQGGYLFGSLAWYDGGVHHVRIPIAVRPVVSDNYADL